MEFETIHAKQILTPVGWLENAMVTIKNGKIIKIEQRSEERRVGKECRSGGSPAH